MSFRYSQIYNETNVNMKEIIPVLPQYKGSSTNIYSPQKKTQELQVLVISVSIRIIYTTTWTRIISSRQDFNQSGHIERKGTYNQDFNCYTYI